MSIKKNSFIALVAITITTSNAMAFASILKDAVNAAMGTSEFCIQLTKNNISKLDPTRDKNCAAVPESDKECFAKCKRISEENLAEKESKKRHAYEQAAYDGEYTSPDLSDSPDRTYCHRKSDVTKIITFDGCIKAYNEGANRAQEKIASAEAARKLLRAEQERADAKIAADSKSLLESTEFNKLKIAISILTRQSRIEIAEKEQLRQREIGKQSGFIDKHQMHQLGAIIVDATNQQKDFFKKYKTLGGEAKSIADIRNKISTCELTLPTIQKMFILAETGNMDTPTPDEAMELKRAGACI